MNLTFQIKVAESPVLDGRSGHLNTFRRSSNLPRSGDGRTGLRVSDIIHPQLLRGFDNVIADEADM